MSLDFSQKYDAPIVTTSLTPQDDGEVSLRPKLLADYTGQEKAKGNLARQSKRPAIWPHC